MDVGPRMPGPMTADDRRVRLIPWLTISLAFCLTDAYVAALIGVAARPSGFGSPWRDAGAVAIDLGMIVVLLRAMHGRSLYSRAAILQPPQLGAIVAVWLQGLGFLLIAGGLAALMQGDRPSGSVVVVDGRLLAVLLAGLAGLLAPRILWWLVRRMGFGRALVHGRALVVGSGDEAEQVIARLASAKESALDVVGVVNDLAQLPVFGVPWVGRVDTLVDNVTRHNINTVIIAMPLAAQRRIAAVIALASRVPVELLLAFDRTASGLLGRRFSMVAGQRLLHVDLPPISGLNAVLKRTEDVLLSASLLVLLAPLLGLIALAIRIDSPGPVLFSQRRYGFNNRVFRMRKFRSMGQAGADPDATRQTARGDVRLTRVGALLRRHSLDELPQLWNVLIGDMSMVGPRPHALGTRAGGQLLAEAVETYVARCRVKPGITGWAQVNGWRGELSSRETLERRVEYDLDYIRNWSLLLDLRILLTTVLRAMHDDRAY